MEVRRAALESLVIVFSLPTLMNLDRSFWKNKKILLTGHTGFKGGWLSVILTYLNAKVFGYSLEAEEQREQS